jgi:hypothetical protein
MTRNKIIRFLGGIMIIALLISTVSLPAKAQDSASDPGIAVDSSVAFAEAPSVATVDFTDSPPALTDEQAAQLQWGVENANRTIPVEASADVAVAGPVPGTESMVTMERPRSGEPMLPGDAETIIWANYGSVIPGGFKSNIMEHSTAGKGSLMFATGNWFAARSVTKGQTWTYLSAFTGFPSFCCDQVVLFDLTRDMFLWLRMGTPDGAGQNVFQLTVQTHNNFSGSYWTYTTAPTNVNLAWTNQWWDYPHMQLGTDYLYISWNMFNQAGTWVRTVMLRWPLNELAAGAGFSYNYFTDASYFTFVPVSGADHTMYFASNWASPPYDHLGIWRWHEDSAGLTFWTKTIAAWTASGRGVMPCGSPNWMARADQRILTGARYRVNNDGIAENRIPGRMVLGWWWNVAEGGGFTLPYIEGAAFYEDTMVQLPGYLGRPYVYGGWCFSYPSFAPNNRGDLGGVFNFSTPPNLQLPIVAFSIADDYWHAPPGWDVIGAAASSGGASDAVWGDYNTVRAYQFGTTWISASHVIPTAGNCSNCSVPIWFSFARQRDSTNFRWW